MIEVDLHLHTVHSDGRLSPSELVRLCARRGLKVIAITDHDSTEGIPEALDAAEDLGGLTVVQGVELGTDTADGEVHLLGYYVNCQDEKFQRAVAEMRDGRDERARQMVAKLNAQGVNISWDRVRELSDGGAVGRPHVAQAMVEGGYVQYPRDAFDRYLGRNGSAYVERVKLTPVTAVELLVSNGALPVMAHPIYYMAGTGPSEVAKLKRTLADMKDAGMVGMEVYYAQYSSEEVDFLAGLADEMELIPCGGSDYHAAGNPGEPEPGSAGPPMDTVTALMSVREQIAAASGQE
jgi:predicted metal-dependent phosphoesterase TrpH